MRPFIVMGDVTDHGGVVVGASSVTLTHDKRIARVGDQVTCPKKGHGTTVIVTGDPTMIIDGKPVARHGDRCACGAVLISSQVVSRVVSSESRPSSGASTMSASPVASFGWLRRLATHQETHDMRFLVEDEVSGQPLAKLPYRITLLGGAVLTGVTDDAGFTERVASTHDQMAQIEVPFYGDDADPTYARLGHDACDC